MKKLIFTISLFLGFNFVYSQVISLNEEKIITKDETLTGWVFNICEDIDYAKEDIKKFLKDRYDLKVKKDSKNTLVVPEAVLTNVSPKRGDLLIYTQHSESGNIMGLSFVMGYDIYLNSKDNEKEMGYFRDFAREFIEYHFDSYYTDLIEDLDKQLNSAKKELHKREGDVSSMKKKEMNLDKKLSKEEDTEKQKELEKDIEELLAEIDDTYDLLPALKEKVETLQDKRDENKEKLIDYQNNIKRL